MDATLSLHNSEMADEDIQELAFVLTQSINQETDLSAYLPEDKAIPGTKGGKITLGVVVLAALTSGTVSALFPVLQSYVERKPSLQIELKFADGREIKIAAEHLSQDQIKQTMEEVKQLCHDGKN